MPTDTLVEIPAWRTSHFASWRLQVIRAAPTGSDYDDIIELRSRMYGIPRGDAGDEIDGHSTLYCAYAGGTPVGTMRVTAALGGRLDCEEFYPHALLEAFRPRLGSASRFAVRQDLPPGMQVARVLIEAAWLHQIRRGIRLDVTNAHRRALRYYERIGYRPVAGSSFLHPRLGTPSYVIVSVADPARGPLRHLFRDIEAPLLAEDLERLVRLTTSADCTARDDLDRRQGKNRHVGCDAQAGPGDGDLVLGGSWPPDAGRLPSGALG